MTDRRRAREADGCITTACYPHGTVDKDRPQLLARAEDGEFAIAFTDIAAICRIDDDS